MGPVLMAAALAAMLIVIVIALLVQRRRDDAPRQRTSQPGASQPAAIPPAALNGLERRSPLGPAKVASAFGGAPVWAASNTTSEPIPAMASVHESSAVPAPGALQMATVEGPAARVLGEGLANAAFAATPEIPEIPENPERDSADAGPPEVGEDAQEVGAVLSRESTPPVWTAPPTPHESRVVHRTNLVPGLIDEVPTEWLLMTPVDALGEWPAGGMIPATEDPVDHAQREGAPSSGGDARPESVEIVPNPFSPRG